MSTTRSSSAHLQLLLVEDNPDDAELVVLELERAGFEVSEHRVDTEIDLEVALDAGPWDLIISDFQMPAFDGLRAFEVVKARRIETPFIFVSGALGEEQAVEAMRAGARDYLLKDNLGRLGVTVRRELDQARQRWMRARAEAERERKQQRLAVALEATLAGLFEDQLDRATRPWLDARAAEIVDLDLDDELPFDSFIEWLATRVEKPDRRPLLDAHRLLVDGVRQRMDVEVMLAADDGEPRHVRCFAQAARRAPDGRAAHVVGVLLDETRRHRLVDELRQAQKMEAIGRLAGGVAHDFNNLLTAIFSFGGFALDALPGDSQAASDIQEVLHAAESARWLTRQLLAFSRQDALSPRIVDLNELIGNTRQMLTRTLGEDIACTTELDSELWCVRVDPNAFNQVLVNLAINACDAMPDGGRLLISTRNVELDSALRVRSGDALPAGAYVVLGVTDTGTGMTDEVLEKIFEPFFTTKAPDSGTGLGLSTCYGIIKQAGGVIDVDSQRGRGTTFDVYLPRTQAPLSKPVSSPTITRLTGRERVLVVEDNPVVRLLAVRVLASLGYDVLEADDGSVALSMSATLETPPDLVLTDVLMAQIGGPELARSLARRWPDCRVLFMSGYTADQIAHDNLLDADVALLHKPFTPERLARKVREVLDT